jgi:hypothetical protein
MQAPGGPLTEKRVTLAKGDRTAILLSVREPVTDRPAPAPAPPPPTPEPPPSGGRRTATYVIGAAGLAGIVVGAVTGGLALAKKSKVDQNCGLGGVPEVCNHTGKTAADALKTLGLVSTIGFSVGLAAAGTSVILFVTEPRDKPAGSSGAVFGVGGTW